MGELHRLPNPEDTEREASDWVARMNADDVTADDRARFEAWLRAHPCNAKAYAELADTWNELVRSGPLVRAVYFGQAMNAASARYARTPRWLAGALAATVAAIVIGTGWSFYKQQADTRFQTAIGEQVAVMLPDGSSVNLNTNSQVDVDYSQDSRIIHLERGEAYFTVAHDAASAVLGARRRSLGARGRHRIQRLPATGRCAGYGQRRHGQRGRCDRRRVAAFGRFVCEIGSGRDCR